MKNIKKILKKHPYLSVPDELWNTHDDLIEEICNGCGAAGKFDFVPDTIWGLSVSPACFVHDFRYHFGESEEDKKIADMEFLANTIRIINHDENSWASGRSFRRWRAATYYTAVYEKGHDAFWAGKK